MSFLTLGGRNFYSEILIHTTWTNIFFGTVKFHLTKVVFFNKTLFLYDCKAIKRNVQTKMMRLFLFLSLFLTLIVNAQFRPGWFFIPFWSVIFFLLLASWSRIQTELHTINKCWYRKYSANKVFFMKRWLSTMNYVPLI